MQSFPPTAQRVQEAGIAADWQREPFRSDGLEDLQQRWATKQESGAARSQASAGSRVVSARPGTAPAGSALRAASAMSSRAAAAAAASAEDSHLQQLVQLLAGCKPQQLAALERGAGGRRLLGLYRALRAQRFLRFTADDLRAREAKLEAAVEASFRPKRMVLSRQQADEFLARLMADAAKREANKNELAKRAAAVESAALAAGRRPCSAR